MAGPATLRPPPPCAPRWHKMLAVAVLLATAGCSGAADGPSTSRSTQPPAAPTDTGATVPAFDRGRFAAVIPVPGAASMTVAGGWRDLPWRTSSQDSRPSTLSTAQMPGRFHGSMRPEEVRAALEDGFTVRGGRATARLPCTHLGAIGLSHGLCTGSLQATIRPPCPIALTR